jgi:hypothetical protein
MAEHGTPDQITSQAPFIQALVQKSVTAITNLAGRLSFGMLGESWSTAQGGTVKKMVLRLLFREDQRLATDLHGFSRILISSCLIRADP